MQFGGQTAINLSQSLDAAGLPILGSSALSIDTASDRHLFEEFLARVNIPNPPGSTVGDIEQALKVAQEVGYPVLVRPSYVLGGRAMEIVQNASELVRYMNSYAVLKWKYFEWREWSAGPDLDQLMMQDLDPDRHVSGESLRVTDIFSGNIRALVRFALDDGASVVMMTPPYSRTNPDWGNNFIPHMERINAEIIACSADYKVPLIDLDSELNGREESFRDPLHLVQDAVAVKAGRVANLISQLILEGGK